MAGSVSVRDDGWSITNTTLTVIKEHITVEHIAARFACGAVAGKRARMQHTRTSRHRATDNT